MYRDIIFFNIGDMIFKHISDISIYITSVIYLWCLTSLNKHEHCTFQNQNATRVIYMSVFLKGTDCLQNSFDGIFILSDKVAFMRELLRLQPLLRKPLVLPLSKRLLLAENQIAFSIITPSQQHVLLVAQFFCVFCSNSLGVSIIIFFSFFLVGGEKL